MSCSSPVCLSKHIITFIFITVPFGNVFSLFGNNLSYTLDFLPCIYYTTDITIKQQLNCYKNRRKECFKMKKTYKIEVDCANCANLMENETKKTDGVANATVNFMLQKMFSKHAKKLNLIAK